MQEFFCMPEQLSASLYSIMQYIYLNYEYWVIVIRIINTSISVLLMSVFRWRLKTSRPFPSFVTRIVGWRTNRLTPTQSYPSISESRPACLSTPRCRRLCFSMLRIKVRKGRRLFKKKLGKKRRGTSRRSILASQLFLVLLKTLMRLPRRNCNNKLSVTESVTCQLPSLFALQAPPSPCKMLKTQSSMYRRH